MSFSNDRYDVLLENIKHRPYPLPSSIWLMTQTWTDLLFMHWPISAQVLRDLIPSSLEVDTFDGDAWIGVVPFGMNNVRFRGTPKFAPFNSNFLELNVRTYVRYKGKSGVYFFSLDASHPIAVEVARASFKLPYYHARMTKKNLADETVAYRSVRVDSRGGEAVFEATYRAIGQAFFAAPGTLENWLTERYCLFSSDSRSDEVFIGEVHHAQWSLQPAEAEVAKNTMVEVIGQGIKLPPTQPLLHYSKELLTVEWTLRKSSGQ